MNDAWTDEQARTTLRKIFDAAIASAAPDAAVRRHLPESQGRCIVLGAGKASAAMVAALDVTGPTWLSRAWSPRVMATRFLLGGSGSSRRGIPCQI